MSERKGIAIAIKKCCLYVRVYWLHEGHTSGEPFDEAKTTREV